MMNKIEAFRLADLFCRISKGNIIVFKKNNTYDLGLSLHDYMGSTQRWHFSYSNMKGK